MGRSYKKLSQRGFSPLFVVVGVVILGVIILIAMKQQTPFIQQKSESQVSDQTPINESKLEKIENETYTFYFPKDYIKLDKKRQADTVLYYAPAPSKASKEEGISLAISFVSTRMDTPSSEFCKEMLQFAVGNDRNIRDRNIRIVETKPVDYIKSHGCDFTYVSDGTDETVVFHRKPLWFKEGDDLLIYDVTSSYLTKASQEVQDNLNQAVNNFVLK